VLLVGGHGGERQHALPPHGELIMYGWRAVIGVIDLATSATILHEYYQVVPPGVVPISSRLVLPGGEATEAALVAMTESTALEDAAEQLAWARPGIIAFACTTGSLIKGPGWDKVLRDRMEGRTGIPATTTSTAVLAAFEALGVRRLGIATPYIDELNRRERDFFEALGYEVRAIRGLGIREDREIGAQSPETAYRLAREVDGAGVDCLFVSCTNFPTLPVIARLEADTGKPVVTSNQATIRHTLRRAGIGEPLSGFGRLLER
jgi:maleate isomerase